MTRRASSFSRTLPSSETFGHGLLRFLVLALWRLEKPAATPIRALALPDIVHRRGRTMAGGLPDGESSLTSLVSTVRRGWHDQGVAAGVIILGELVSHIIRQIPKFDAQLWLDVIPAVISLERGCFVVLNGSRHGFGPNR